MRFRKETGNNALRFTYDVETHAQPTEITLEPGLTGEDFIGAVVAYDFSNGDDAGTTYVSIMAVDVTHNQQTGAVESYGLYPYVPWRTQDTVYFTYDRTTGVLTQHGELP